MITLAYKENSLSERITINLQSPKEVAAIMHSQLFQYPNWYGWVLSKNKHGLKILQVISEFSEKFKVSRRIYEAPSPRSITDNWWGKDVWPPAASGVFVHRLKSCTMV